MDWCEKRPFGHQTSHHTFYIIFLAVLTKTVSSEVLKLRSKLPKLKIAGVKPVANTYTKKNNKKKKYGINEKSVA